MDRSLRDASERNVGTRDFDPKINLNHLERAAGLSEAEPEAAEPSDERAASLYDAIRDMSTYGSARETDSQGNDDDGLSRSP